MHLRTRAAVAATAGLLAGLLASPASAAEVEQDVTLASVVSAPPVDPADTAALEASACFTGLVSTHGLDPALARAVDATVVAEERVAGRTGLTFSLTAQAWTFTLDDGTTTVPGACLLAETRYVLDDARAGEPVTLDLDATAVAAGVSVRLGERDLLRAAGTWRLEGVTSATAATSRRLDPAAVDGVTTALAAEHGAFADRTVEAGDTYLVAPHQRTAAARTLHRARLRALLEHAAAVSSADRTYARARVALSVATVAEQAAAKVVVRTGEALERAKQRAGEATAQVRATTARQADARAKVDTYTTRSRSEAKKADTFERKQRAARTSRSAATRRKASAYASQAKAHDRTAAAHARSAASWRDRLRRLADELASWRRALDQQSVEQAQLTHDRAVAAHQRTVEELERATAAFAEADATRAAGVDEAKAARDAALAAAQAAYDAAIVVTVTAETAGTARVWTATTVS